MRILSMIYKAAALFALASMVWWCTSTPHGNSPFLNESGKHPDNWIVDHRASYVSDPDACKECHGTDLKGGISKVSCFSAQFNGQTCHAGGPVSHPAGWR